MSVDKEIRNVLKLNTNSHWINKVIIECFISVLNPIFDNMGTVKLLSTRNEKITKESLQKIYDQCNKLVL